MLKHIVFITLMLFTAAVFYTTGILVAGGQKAIERVILDLHNDL